MNLKQSGISGASRKSERALLPRALEFMWDALDIMADMMETGRADEAEELAISIIDFSDAFF